MVNVKYVLLVDLDEPDDDKAEEALEIPFDLEHFCGMVESIEVELETSDHLGDTVIINYRRL